MGFLSGLLNSEDMTAEQRSELAKCISEKNLPGLDVLCERFKLTAGLKQRLESLLSLYGQYSEVIGELKHISITPETDAALDELNKLNKVMCRLGIEQDVYFDFSIINDISYYDGIIFHGYVENVPVKVLSGGRYDKLLQKFGKNSGAIGFAVYLDMLERSGSAEPDRTAGIINIALPKGRLGEKAYAIFEAAGYGCPAIHEESRKLVFENLKNGVRYFWVKPSDVAIYVERGAADIGIAGKDILLEYSPDVYELLDLKIGKCRMCVAAQKGHTVDRNDRTLRAATKFPNIAREHYKKQGRAIDIIGLNGSIELAPILGLSDVIVDIVETGKTLTENNMYETETIADISARLIANKASHKFNHNAISILCEKIAVHIE